MKPLKRKLAYSLALLVLLFTAQLASAFYDPSLGRWLTRDPVEELDGLNMYTYAHNDFVNKTDPDGRLCLGVTTCLLTSPIRGPTCTFSCTTFCCIAPRTRGPVAVTIPAPLGLGLCPPLVYWPEL